MTQNSVQNRDEQRLALAMEAAGLDLWENDLITGVVTRKATRIFAELGYSEAEALAYVDDLFLIVHPDDVQRIKAALSEHLAGRTAHYRCEFRVRSRAGDWIWYANHGKIMDAAADQRGHRLIGVTFNIDERKREESERESLSRALRLLSACSTALIHADVEQDFLDAICKLAVDTGGYRSAWVDLVKEDDAKPTDPHRTPGSVAPVARGQEASIALPLLFKNQVIGMLSIDAADPFAFCTAEVALLEELAKNLAYGLASLRTRAALLESETQHRELLRNLHTAIVVHAPDTSILYSNPRAATLLGLSIDQMFGKVAMDPDWCFMDEQGRPLALQDYPVNRVRRSREPFATQVLGVRQPDGADATWLLVSAFPEFRADGDLKQIVVNFDDISERKRAEEEIHHLAFFDSLTRLPNRRMLMDRLHTALAVSARSNAFGAVLFIDLDKFKTTNDIHGHDVGDLLLIEAAARIQASVRRIDTVARLGGDEFVVLLAEIDDGIVPASQKTAQIGEKIRLALNAPYLLKDHPHHSSPSIGVSLFCGNMEAPEALLRQADMAMYKAKDAGRNTLRFFNAAMQLAVETHATMETDLRHAVPDQQLVVHYQIQVDNAQRVLGAEALVRWQHPGRGLVSPMQFIPIAEESSLILDIGGWVLGTACRQLAKWQQIERYRHLTLAVNVSAQQFRQADFVEVLAAVLQRHEFEPARLKLELTESVVLNDVGDVVSKMTAIRELGVKLSMDDFGTGYSSLSYLKQLPLDQIKIDQSFVRDISTDPNDAVMVKTIIDLANNFRLHVIAEGVETEAQLAFLKHHGCMAYQGYLFGKPMPIETLESLLLQQHKS